MTMRERSSEQLADQLERWKWLGRQSVLITDQAQKMIEGSHRLIMELSHPYGREELDTK